MDCFDKKYYRLNRKLLTVVGQWPYLDRSERAKKWFVFFIAVVLQVTMQGGQAMKSDIDFEYCCELLAESLVTIIVSIKYINSAINSNKIKGLLDDIRLTWQSLEKSDEYDLFCESAEEGRIYIVRYAVLMLSMVVPNVLVLLSSPLLIYTPLSNVSCPILMIYLPDLFINPEKHCYPLLLCVCFVLITMLVSLCAIDLMYINIIFHAIAMFKLVCYRLERIFDESTDETKPSSNRTYICERIANAVEWHRAATRFCDDIVSAYTWAILISLTIALVGIAISMYWIAMEGAQTMKRLINLTLSFGHIVHIFVMYVPAQQMLDNSTEVTFKAYSSLWYTARVKEQMMILLTMQRGLKASTIAIGGLYESRLQSFATVGFVTIKGAAEQSEIIVPSTNSSLIS